MLLTSAEVARLDEERLRAILELRQPEGRTLDYKRALSGSGETPQERFQSAAAEFKKDVSAFANADGGILIIGAREPDPTLPVEDQLSGLRDGADLQKAFGVASCDDLAKRFERIARTIDPPISGLQVVSIPLTNGANAVVVHVPPSASKPHMVERGGVGTFYVRNTESSVSMSAAEVRESVLSSASAEGAARLYLDAQAADVREHVLAGPLLLVQGMPIIRPTPLWNLMTPEVDGVMSGIERRSRPTREVVPIASGYQSYPTLSGIGTKADSPGIQWELEVHSEGYVQLCIPKLRSYEEAGTSCTYIHAYETRGLLLGFFQLLQELWSKLESDLPYVFRFQVMNSRGCRLKRAWDGEHLDYAYPRPNLSLRDVFRQVGAELAPIAEEWHSQLHAAFRERLPPRPQ